MADFQSPRCRELDNLAEQVGVFIQYWGFKKVHGRIWTHLYLSPCPLDAGCLIERLEVSKALVSLSLKDLLEYQVVVNAGLSGKGTQLFRANPQVITVILNVIRLREKRLLAETAMAFDLLREAPPPSECVDQARMVALGNMISQARMCMDNLLALSTLSLASWQEFHNHPLE